MINLYNHQKKALENTKNHNRVAYYLDMGLGKTFVGSEKLHDLGEKMNLVVCQKSKINDWYKHFKDYYPEYEVIVYNRQRIPNNKKVILIINYDLAWRRENLKTLKNFTLMLDESSMIKNLSSNRTKFILKLKPKNVILLSGTPVGGKYEELYSQIRLLGWDIPKRLFYHQFMVTTKINIGGFPIEKVVGYKNVDRLKERLREHGAIFMKTEEVFDLPEVREIMVNVQSTKEYAKFKKTRIVEIGDKEIIGDTSLGRMLGERQLAGAYNENKYNELKTILESTESRLIIFYNFKYECEAIKEICKKLNKPISEVNGSINDLSNYEDQENSVTLIQYQAGSMGLNLQKANKIIYFSLPLQSDLFEQSKKRIHRIGQQNICLYYYLITQNSVEEKILKVLKERKDFTDELFNDMED